MPSAATSGLIGSRPSHVIPGIGRLLTQQEAADLLGISLRSVIRMVRAGELKSVPVGPSGRHVRIPLTSVERWVKGQLKKSVA